MAGDWTVLFSYTPAGAAILEFDVVWENTFGAPGATGVGVLALDDSLLLNPGVNSLATNDPFASFVLEIQGPSSAMPRTSESPSASTRATSSG